MPACRTDRSVPHHGASTARRSPLDRLPYGLRRYGPPSTCRQFPASPDNGGHGLQPAVMPCAYRREIQSAEYGEELRALGKRPPQIVGLRRTRPLVVHSCNERLIESASNSTGDDAGSITVRRNRGRPRWRPICAVHVERDFWTEPFERPDARAGARSFY